MFCKKLHQESRKKADFADASAENRQFHLMPINQYTSKWNNLHEICKLM